MVGCFMLGISGWIVRVGQFRHVLGAGEGGRGSNEGLGDGCVRVAVPRGSETLSCARF